MFQLPGGLHLCSFLGTETYTLAPCVLVIMVAWTRCTAFKEHYVSFYYFSFFLFTRPSAHFFHDLNFVLHHFKKSSYLSCKHVFSIIKLGKGDIKYLTSSNAGNSLNCHGIWYKERWFKWVAIFYLTNFNLDETLQRPKDKIDLLLLDKGLDTKIADLLDIEFFGSNTIHKCQYYDENKYNDIAELTDSTLTIYSLNIRSLNKHKGELVAELKCLKGQFDIILLTKIGARNLNFAVNFMEEYDFFYVQPSRGNFYGGVGIYIYIKKKCWGGSRETRINHTQIMPMW